MIAPASQPPQPRSLFKAFRGTWESDLGFMALVFLLAAGALVALWQSGYFGAPEAEKPPQSAAPGAPPANGSDGSAPAETPPVPNGGGGGGPVVKPKTKWITVTLVVLYAIQVLFWGMVLLLEFNPWIFPYFIVCILGLILHSLKLSESKNMLEILTYANGVLGGLSLVLTAGAFFARKRMVDAFFPRNVNRAVVAVNLLLLFVLLISLPLYTLYDDRANTTQTAVASAALGLGILLVLVSIFAATRRASKEEEDLREYGDTANEVLLELQKKDSFEGWEALTGLNPKEIVYYAKNKSLDARFQLPPGLERKLRDLDGAPLMDDKSIKSLKDIDEIVAGTSAAKRALGEVFNGQGLVSYNELAGPFDERLEDMMSSNPDLTYSEAISALARHVLSGGKYALDDSQKEAIEAVDSSFNKDVFENYAKKRLQMLIKDPTGNLEQDLKKAVTENPISDLLGKVNDSWWVDDDATEKEKIRAKRSDARSRRGEEAAAHIASLE